MKNLLSIILILSVCLSFAGCNSNDTDTPSANSGTLEAPKSLSASLGATPEIAITVGETKSVAFKFGGNGDLSDMNFSPVVINESLLSMEYERISGKYIYYNVTAKAEGTTEIYLELSGTALRSENIKFVVTKSMPEYIIGAHGEGSFSVIEGHTKTICFAVLGSDLAPDDVKIVMGDTKIAKASYVKVSGDYIYYKIEGVEPGSTTVYLETVDGIVQSERITVAVIEKGNITDSEISEIGFIANKNSKIFHLTTCSLADSIKDENKLYFECERDALIEEGYQPCKTCKP